MIHYHGTPMTPRSELWKMAGKHFCISFPDHRDTDICFNIGQSIMLDNGAFSLFTKGLELDLSKFYKWIEPYLGHPHWAVVPDVIDGKKEDNLALIKQWPFRKDCAAVVWHLSEPIDHLSRLIDLNFGKIAFGSSKEYWKIGSEAWKKNRGSFRFYCKEWRNSLDSYDERIIFRRKTLSIFFSRFYKCY